MNVLETGIEGLRIIEPKAFADPRGFFFELWNENRYRQSGIQSPFVQDNVSFSRRGTLRGLHFQQPNPQGKLVSALHGEVFDVAVDLRRSSTTFKKWFGILLSAENKRQLYVPEGFAHGFVVLSETAIFHYKCTGYYSPKDEVTLRWDDQEIGIEWPVESPFLSGKDEAGLRLSQLPESRLFS